MLKNSKYALGIGFLALGIVFVLVNYLAITWEDMYFPKLLMAGILLTVLGIGFLLFPGVDADVSNSKGYFKRLWKGSPVLHRIMWIVFTLGGIALSIWVMVYFELPLD